MTWVRIPGGERDIYLSQTLRPALKPNQPIFIGYRTLFPRGKAVEA